LAKLSSVAEEEEDEGSQGELDKHSKHFLKYAKQIRDIQVRQQYSLKLDIVNLLSSGTWNNVN